MAVALFGWLLGAFLWAYPAQAEPLDWLQLDETLQANYQVSSVEGADHRLNIISRKMDGGPVRKILGILPSRSVAAYSTTVNTFTAEFSRSNTELHLHLWYYAGDKEDAGRALSWAEEQGYDLVLTIGSGAAQFVSKSYRGGKLPVVTAAAKDPVLRGQMPDYLQGSGTNIAYTSINVPTSTLFAYLTQMIPDLANVAVLYDETNGSALETQVNPLVAFSQDQPYRVLKVGVENPQKAVADLSRLIPQAIDEMRKTDPELAHSILLLTGSTSVYSEIDLINENAGRLPVVSLLPDVVRDGDSSAVVSIGSTMAATVRLSSRYALMILAGEKQPGELKVGVVTPPDIAVSFRKARQIGLKIPFRFMEQAGFIYDYDGHAVRANGQIVEKLYQ